MGAWRGAELPEEPAGHLLHHPANPPVQRANKTAATSLEQPEFAGLEVARPYVAGVTRM